MSTRLGLRGWPNAAEDIIVARNVILSEYTGAHIHLQHISSQFSVDVIRRAKQRGARITAEATPHHIALTDDALATYDTEFQNESAAAHGGGSPRAHRRPARRHARHHRHRPRAAHRLRKGQGVRLTPPTASSASRPRWPSLSKFWCGRTNSSCRSSSTLMTRRPARLMKLPGGTLAAGAAADICLFDPDGEMALRRESRLQQVEQLPVVRPDAHRPREDHDRRWPRDF